MDKTSPQNQPIYMVFEKEKKLKKRPSPGTEWTVHVANIPSILLPPPYALPPLHFLPLPPPIYLLAATAEEAAAEQLMAAATVWLLQRPSPALHNSLSLPSSQHPSSSASPPLHKKPKDLLLCCASSGASSSVVAKEQEEAATAPPEEGSESPLLSYKDDPNFRYLLSFLQLSIQRLQSPAFCGIHVI